MRSQPLQADPDRVEPKACPAAVTLEGLTYEDRFRGIVIPSREAIRRATRTVVAPAWTETVVLAKPHPEPKSRARDAEISLLDVLHAWRVDYLLWHLSRALPGS
jgi:hypothetical protein